MAGGEAEKAAQADASQTDEAQADAVLAEAARRERVKEALYALDLSGVEWVAAPGTDPANRVEIAYLPEGAVAMRNSAEPEGPVLRYTAAEWLAFTLGARDGEFDI